MSGVGEQNGTTIIRHFCYVSGKDSDGLVMFLVKFCNCMMANLERAKIVKVTIEIILHKKSDNH